MDILERHEIFEMEVLERLNSERFLDPLVFGGGTMLRLCYGLDRYSADLDFWFVKKMRETAYFNKLRRSLGGEYEITDARIKFYTLLFEIRSKGYPRRLKIEIRRKMKECDFQERIAFSEFSAKQVALKVHTPGQTMKNKIEAAIDRGEVRDFYDIEFLLRKGTPLSASRDKLARLKETIDKFTDNDIRVTLGSLVEPGKRSYYLKNRFQFLSERISSGLSH